MSSLRFQRGRLIVLPVRLIHRKTDRRRMVLDTGARVTVVRPEVAERIGLELRESPDDELIGIASSASVSVGTVDSVFVLGHTVRSLEVVCHPLHPELPFDGVVGVDLIQHFNIAIDNDAERITFEARLT